MANTGGQELDSFVIESGRRKIVLWMYNDTRLKRFEIRVYMIRAEPGRGANPAEVLISTAEYINEDSATTDFEMRRPRMRDAQGEAFEMPMQKGKRLIQEVMKEKLGGN